MKLHELKPNPGSTRKKKRLGRGTASGQGKTAGRGMNGQGSRSGRGKGPGFEGGNIPLYRKLPKRGFTNIFGTQYAELNVEVLNQFDDGAVITPELLKSEGILKKQLDGVKILGNGELGKKLTVKAHKFSKSAVEKIEAAGGKAEVI